MHLRNGVVGGDINYSAASGKTSFPRNRLRSFRSSGITWYFQSPRFVSMPTRSLVYGFSLAPTSSFLLVPPLASRPSFFFLLLFFSHFHSAEQRRRRRFIFTRHTTTKEKSTFHLHTELKASSRFYKNSDDYSHFSVPTRTPRPPRRRTTNTLSKGYTQG